MRHGGLSSLCLTGKAHVFINYGIHYIYLKFRIYQKMKHSTIQNLNKKCLASDSHSSCHKAKASILIHLQLSLLYLLILNNNRFIRDKGHPGLGNEIV